MTDTGRSTPLISVITVCKDAARAIVPTVGSVLGQDYAALEYVIVDGRSTDQTVEAAARAAAGRRLTIVSEEDRGIADAMNKGVALSRGELIVHLHAGDTLIEPGVLSRVAASHAAWGWTWAVGGVVRIPEVPGRPRVLQQPLRYDYGYLQRVCYLPHQGTVLHRDIFRRHGGFHTGFQITMDYEFWLRIGASERAYILPFPVAAMPDGGASRDPLRNLREDVRARRMHVHPYTLGRTWWDVRVWAGRSVDLHLLSRIPAALRSGLLRTKRRAWDTGRGWYFLTRELDGPAAG